MEELILKAMSYLLVFSLGLLVANIENMKLLEKHHKENQRRKKREEAIKNQ